MSVDWSALEDEFEEHAVACARALLDEFELLVELYERWPSIGTRRLDEISRELDALFASRAR